MRYTERCFFPILPDSTEKSSVNGHTPASFPLSLILFLAASCSSSGVPGVL